MNAFSSPPKAIIILVLLIGNFLSYTSAQQKAVDISIPYNEKWAMCDTPLASYYRVGQIGTDKRFFFTGAIKDYYENDRLQMQGTYDDKGLKQGVFTYYYPNGSVERRGNFENDQMRGLWNYYNEKGNRFLALFCQSDREFTPLLYVNSKGDTILTGGDGKFVLPIDEYKNIFWNTGLIKIRFIKGECINGKKEGIWKLYGDHGNESSDQIENSNLTFTETYKEGKLEYGRSYALSDKGAREATGRNALSVYPAKHLQTDTFVADYSLCDLFVDRDDSYNFLFSDFNPSIVSQSKSFKNNMQDYIACIQSAVMLTSDYEMEGWPFKELDRGYWVLFNDIKPLHPYQEVPASGDLNIQLTLSSAGVAKDIQVEGGLSPNLKNAVKYYLSLLKNLHTDDAKEDRIVNLKLSINNQPGIYRGRQAYTSFAMISLAEGSYPFAKAIVQNSEIVEATPPSCGKNDSDWIKYLQTTLNSTFKAQPKLKPSRGIMFRYVVNEDGSVSDFRAIDAGKELAPELIILLTDVVSNSPKWKPAELLGKPIKYTNICDIVL